jgi:hypothetical protein
MTFRRAILFALLIAGCKDKALRVPCAPGQASKVEVRDQGGALELAVKPGDRPGAFELCDPANHPVGTIVQSGSTLTLTDRANALVLRLERQSPDDATGAGPKGPKLRVHREHGETRVLDKEGVPFGSVGVREGGATLFSRASVPVGLVEPRDKDQVLKAMDGATRLYVVPSDDPVAAGLLGVEGLPLEERLALFLLFSQNAR